MNYIKIGRIFFKFCRLIDKDVIIAYNINTKKHTIFVRKRGVKNVSSKEHGCKRKLQVVMR